MCITAYGDEEAIAVLGERLREERLRRNVTVAHLASLVGCSRGTLAKLEAGDPGVALRVLARVLGVMGLERRLPEVVPDPARLSTSRRRLAHQGNGQGGSAQSETQS